MFLPNADRAEIDDRKLIDYCLSPEHPVGKHKAAVFRSALGLSIENADSLREMLRVAATSGDAVPGVADEFGQRFVVDFDATTLKGTARVRSAWIIRSGEDFPRMTTCYILSE